MWWQPHNFEKKYANLKTRRNVINAVRSFFDNQSFDEAQTPALQIMGAPDTHIKSFQTEGFELHTSPEIAMKKLLVAGMERIYQICPVYRKEENTRLHSPEFTMLEWYRAGQDYTAMMNDCEALIKSLGVTIKGCDIIGDWERLSVADAFKKYADIDLNQDLKKQAAAKGIRIIETDQYDDIFHAIMAEKIEPFLGIAKPTFLYDYPIQLGALARQATNPNYAERFELYIKGVELANAFSELTDPIEQKRRLIADLDKKKSLYGIQTPIDDDFIKALEFGMPESAGCALGLDRLIMLICDTQNIEDVLWAGKP